MIRSGGVGVRQPEKTGIIAIYARDLTTGRRGDKKVVRGLL